MLELQPGSLFEGRYEIIRQLGAGGMGAVYLARKTEDREKLFAIKVLYPGRIKNDEARERFRNEITATLKVNHPNVVRAYEYFDEEDFQAYVMEYVEGGDLISKMKLGKLDPGFVLRYLKQITAGLAAVHEQGIIHRDLKPDNLLYDEVRDELKLHDFGVARLKGANPLTLVGAMVGTPKYLSPEYVETGSCDHRGDIYATGIIGYEMATGSSPFRSTSKVSLMVERLKTRIPPLKDVEPDFPLGLAKIIDKAIAIKVSERYQSAREMWAELDALEPESEPAPEPVSPPARVRTITETSIAVPKRIEMEQAPEPTVLEGQKIETFKPILKPIERHHAAHDPIRTGIFWLCLLLSLIGGVAGGSQLVSFQYAIQPTRAVPVHDWLERAVVGLSGDETQS